MASSHGGRVIEIVEAVAREMGCCKVTLEVLEGNAQAQALYRQCGYIVQCPVDRRYVSWLSFRRYNVYGY